MIFLFTFFLSNVMCNDTLVNNWDYGRLGPDAWPTLFRTCNGSMQSPININESEALYDPELRSFRLVNTNQFYIVNNTGSTVIFTPENSTMILGGSNFKEKYRLVQFHFHWGENEYQGSEHYINGIKYPLEFHMVFRSSNNKTTVLGVLFEECKETFNPFNRIFRAHLDARDLAEKPILRIGLTQLLSNLGKDYYRYIGSLTVPPCTENVLWSIFRKRLCISKKQLDVFRVNTIKKNFREPQNLFSRKVYASFPNREQNSIPKSYNQSENKY